MPTTQRNAPYRHKDGSNCWTKNCSLGNDSAAKNALMKEWFAPKTEVKPTAFGNISSIASQEEFTKAHEDGRVSRQRHPDYPYSIYKYTPVTVFKKDWDDITMASRGLIVNDETGEIIARPFAKFFNHNEVSAPVELLKGPISVTEKLDGSLGISFMTPDGLQISTAGGFQSEQGAHATAVYREKYEGKWEPRKDTTYMWEIIYPENRIVVDYENEDDLYLIGAVNIKTGKSIPLSQITEWKGKRAVEHTDLSSLDSVVNSPDRNNHEGFVVHYLDTDARVKFKHAEYLHYHRYATGITSRKIWDNMREGVDDTEWIQNAPEEFEDFINSKKAAIQADYDKEYNRLTDGYNAFVATLPKDISQKEFAQAATQRVAKEDLGAFFSLRNRGELEIHARKSIWDKIKPPAEKAF